MTSAHQEQLSKTSWTKVDASRTALLREPSVLATQQLRDICTRADREPGN